MKSAMDLGVTGKEGEIYSGSGAAQCLIKRALDVLGAGVGLLLFSPVFLIVACLIKRSNPGPIFFRQERIGLGGRSFRIVKFRSMRTDAEETLRTDKELYAKYVANSHKLPDGEDPRLTPIGRWLRKSSLDELPQLWNVMLGDMTLVGPRPLLQDEIDTWYPSTYERLLSVRPGMTGLWQVGGRSRIPYPERAQMELQYVQEWSLWFDLKILFLTVAIVLKKQGAH